jgi:hypothetical protein
MSKVIEVTDQTFIDGVKGKRLNDYKANSSNRF